MRVSQAAEPLLFFYMADSRKKTDLDPKAPQSTHLTSSTADDAVRQLHWDLPADCVQHPLHL